MTLEAGNEAALNEPDVEALQKKLDELAAKNVELTGSVGRLEAKREELLKETKRRKNLDRVLKAIDIDVDSDEAEAALLQKLSVGLEDKLEAAKLATTPSAPGAPAPTNESLEMKSQLKLMAKKLQAMEEEAKQAKVREQEAIEKRKRDLVELKVKEAFQKLGCIQPAHLYKLQSGAFRLSEDGETVIGGSEHDPRSLEDAIESLKDDQEFSMYFRGNGASGSGMAKGQGGFGGQSLKNPFRTDQLNVTEASVIFSKDPEKAKRLILEARSAGKLDPRLASLAGS